MIHNAHLFQMDQITGSPAPGTDALHLSQQLDLLGETEQAADVAREAYDRSYASGEPDVAGQAAGFASYVLSKAGTQFTESVEYGELSQLALPADKPLGKHHAARQSSIAWRFSGAARVLLSNKMPAKSRPSIAKRAVLIMEDDMAGHAESRRAIVRALSGKSGANIGLQHTKQSFVDAWEKMPDADPLTMAQYAGREAAVGIVTLAFVAPQALGRLATPLRRLQRKAALELVASPNPHLERVDPATVAPLPE